MRMNPVRHRGTPGGWLVQKTSARSKRQKSRREKECVLLSGRLLSCDGLLVREEGERETEREGGRRERERAVDPQLHANC